MFKNPEEYYYFHLMSRWEQTAPPDGHEGVMGNGQAQKNTQTARMCYLLKIIDNGNGETFRKLVARTLRKDGCSYISKDRSWMREPYELNRGWYFEGCMSLHDKQTILQSLPLLGAVSLTFVPCAEDFVGGKSIQKYRPDGDAVARQLEDWVANHHKQADAAQD